MCRNYWSPHTLGPVLCNKICRCNEKKKPAHHNWRVASAHYYQRKSAHSSEDPMQPKTVNAGLSSTCSKLPSCLDVAGRIQPSQLGNFISHFSAAGRVWLILFREGLALFEPLVICIWVVLPKLQGDLVRRRSQVECRTDSMRTGYLVEGNVAEVGDAWKYRPSRITCRPTSPDAAAAIAFEELSLKFSAFWNLPFLCQAVSPFLYPLAVLPKPLCTDRVPGVLVKR